MMRAFAVAVVGLAFLGAEARPVADASPDRVKYRLTPGGAIVHLGSSDACRWI